ncbi:MAG: hypothetical protein R3B45_16460 [Bdellovibrionota bacterium]
MNLKRYPIEDGKLVIEIVLNDFHNLFDQRDPAPFREKDLDDDAVDYIVGSVKEMSIKRLGKLKVYLKQQVNSDLELMIVSAIHSFFDYEADFMSLKIREILQLGTKSLVIGISFLTFAVFVASTVKDISNDFWRLFLKEGMLLMGWVSMWKPLNIFLYEWWPMADTRKIYKCLSNVKVEVKER